MLSAIRQGIRTLMEAVAHQPGDRIKRASVVEALESADERQEALEDDELLRRND